MSETTSLWSGNRKKIYYFECSSLFLLSSCLYSSDLSYSFLLYPHSPLLLRYLNPSVSLYPSVSLSLSLSLSLSFIFYHHLNYLLPPASLIILYDVKSFSIFEDLIINQVISASNQRKYPPRSISQQFLKPTRFSPTLNSSIYKVATTFSL